MHHHKSVVEVAVEEAVEEEEVEAVMEEAVVEAVEEVVVEVAEEDHQVVNPRRKLLHLLHPLITTVTRSCHAYR